MDVKPATVGPALSRDDLGQANLARRAPRKRDAQPRSAPHGRLSIGRTGESCTGIPILYSGRP